jgi:hypothetical protein
MLTIRSPVGEDHDAVRAPDPVHQVLRVGGERRLTVRATCRERDAIEAAVQRHGAKNAPIAATPAIRAPSGGIVSSAYRASSAIIWWRRGRPGLLQAVHQLGLRRRLRGRVHVDERAGRLLAAQPLACALRSAMTAAVLSSNASAASQADQPSTSRSCDTAR